MAFTRIHFFIIFLLRPISSFPSSFQKNLPLQGRLSFENLTAVTIDFGHRYSHVPPQAVLYPESDSDIVAVIGEVIKVGGLSVAARGSGHSLHGQAQAPGGIVVAMRGLRGGGIKVFEGEEGAWVDAPGGAMWIEVLDECFRYGLAPKSWTDYLYLTVGGTLSNGGVSGQAFRHGPQISNALELDVVTGTGKMLTCSKIKNRDLFHSVLGGLGQFGIITRARISLQRSPHMVKWIRVLYSDFSTFVKDQLLLISPEDETFDYIEGFVIINRTGILNNWRSSFKPRYSVLADDFTSEEQTLFCIEMAKHFDLHEDSTKNNWYIERSLSRLSYIESTIFTTEVPYVEFLNRVHESEMKLRSKGLWEVPHPWLNLLVPKSQIHGFADTVFGDILKDGSNGPILIYPLNKTMWDEESSVVIPKEEVFFLVAFLRSAIPSSTGADGLERILAQNQRIIDFCAASLPGVKQYLAHYNTTEGWRKHFLERWEEFARRKYVYDPFNILAPGHRIFDKSLLLLNKGKEEDEVEI